MPNTNQPAGAPGEKQNQDGMFRWEQQGSGCAKLISAKGVECGQIIFIATVWGSYISGSIIEGLGCLCVGVFRDGIDAQANAKQAVLDWWRAAAEQARGLGL